MPEPEQEHRIRRPIHWTLLKLFLLTVGPQGARGHTRSGPLASNPNPQGRGSSGRGPIVIWVAPPSHLQRPVRTPSWLGGYAKHAQMAPPILLRGRGRILAPSPLR